jgi:hypothetical protein
MLVHRSGRWVRVHGKKLVVLPGVATMYVMRTGAVAVTAFLVALVVPFGLVFLSSPERARVVVLSEVDLAALVARNDDLDAERERLLRKIDLAYHLAAHLTAGTLSLGDATTRMEPLLRERCGFHTHCGCSGLDMHRATARYLIDKVQEVLALDPSRWENVSNRLECEYFAIR